MTYRLEKLRSAPPGPRHRVPQTPGCRTLCVITYRHETLRSAPPEPRNRHPEHLDAALYA